MTTKYMPVVTEEKESETEKTSPKFSIEEDFEYGSNVASSHIYIRLGFLRKVYGILSVQLLTTTLVAVLFISSDTIKGFVHTNSWMVLTSIILNFILIFALMIKRNETPTNYILLALFTLTESYAVGVIVTFYDVNTVIQAFAMTCAVTMGLTFYTLQSKRDFSSWGAGLFAVLWVLIIAGFLQIFLHSKLLELAIAAGGAILFSLFIIFDTHMMMHKLSAEEYIMAAINLYLDIINLFLHILRFLNAAKSN